MTTATTTDPVAEENSTGPGAADPGAILTEAQAPIPAAGEARDGSALDREVARIAALGDEEALREVTRSAAYWLAEQGTDLDGDDGLSGTDRIAAAYLQRVAGARAAARPAETGERAYLSLLRHILDHGARRTDRTGIGTYSVFGAQMRFDLRDGFPLLTTKRVVFSSVVKELLWFLRGSTNIADLGCGIWDAWADEDGDLGPIYGHQWRSWGRPYHKAGPLARHGISADWRLSLDQLRQAEADLLAATGRSLPAGSDEPVALQNARAAIRELLEVRTSSHRAVDQIAEALETIRERPDSRRIIVSAWNVADVPAMKLPSCHVLFQFYVEGDCLDCQLYQRSGDMALGVPFNIASYALLLAMFARESGLVPRYLVHTLGDAHVYLNHVDGVREQIGREPYPPPQLVLADKPVLAQSYDDVRIEGYRHHPAISFQVAV